jgi:hypothetical protein
VDLSPHSQGSELDDVEAGGGEVVLGSPVDLAAKEPGDAVRPRAARALGSYPYPLSSRSIVV